VDVPLNANGLPAFNLLGAEAYSKVNTVSASNVSEIFSADYPESVKTASEAAKAKLQQDEATPEELEVIKQMGDGTHGHGDEPARPEAYRVPLKSRLAIAHWLNSQANWETRSYDYNTWLFCFNVKLYALDLSFDHLLERWNRSGEIGADSPLLLDATYVADCRKKYDELYGKDNQRLYDYAVEDASRNVTDDDTYNTLWVDSSIKVTKGFKGRSGGWLVIYKFNGIELTRDLDLTDPDQIDYKTLRQLYEYIVMMSHDFGEGKPEAEVEYQAAWLFFNHDCEEIPRVVDEVGSHI
jgi:hypothetical protein